MCVCSSIRLWQAPSVDRGDAAQGHQRQPGGCAQDGSVSGYPRIPVCKKRCRSFLKIVCTFTFTSTHLSVKNSLSRLGATCRYPFWNQGSCCIMFPGLYLHLCLYPQVNTPPRAFRIRPVTHLNEHTHTYTPVHSSKQTTNCHSLLGGKLNQSHSRKVEAGPK